MINIPKKITLKNNLNVLIRFVEPDDAKKMLAHLAITHAESYKNLNQTADFWEDFSVEKEVEILKDFKASDSKFMLVAVFEEQIIGVLGFVSSPGKFHQKNGTLGMSIQMQYAGQGLGGELMRFAIEAAKGDGFHRMELTVRTYNTAGIALYEKVGFEKIGTLKEVAFIDDEYVDEYSYQLILK